MLTRRETYLLVKHQRSIREHFTSKNFVNISWPHVAAHNNERTRIPRPLHQMKFAHFQMVLTLENSCCFWTLPVAEEPPFRARRSWKHRRIHNPPNKIVLSRVTHTSPCASNDACTWGHMPLGVKTTFPCGCKMQQTCHNREEEGTGRRKVAHAEKVFS